MKPPVPGWEAIRSRQPVQIPSTDGESVAETILVEVPAWTNPKTGEVFLDGTAREKMERIKARHMGLVSNEELKVLRNRLGLTQKQISELLQIGEKTYTRWESGRERPSRSLNLLLCALRDGRVDVNYLHTLRTPGWKPVWPEENIRFEFAIPSSLEEGKTEFRRKLSESFFSWRECSESFWNSFPTTEMTAHATAAEIYSVFLAGRMKRQTVIQHGIGHRSPDRVGPPSRSVRIPENVIMDFDEETSS